MSNSEKKEQQDKKPLAKRTRSTSFPFQSLPKSIEAMKEIVKYGNEVTVLGLASILGHNSAKSGSFLQKLSSLRSWHLLEGHGDVLSVTELSQRLANPIDDMQYKEAVAEAFSHCKVFDHFISGLSSGSELKLSTIGNIAVQKHGVSLKARDSFVSSFVSSAQAAGLVDSVTEDSLVLRTEQETRTVSRRVGQDEGPDGQEEELALKQRSRTSSSAQRVLDQIWDLPGGEIGFEIRSTEPLNASVYEKVGTVVSAIQDLASDLGWNKEPESDETQNTDKQMDPA